MHKPNVITEIMNQDDANAKQAADCEASHGYIDPGKQGDLRRLVKFEKKWQKLDRGKEFDNQGGGPLYEAGSQNFVTHTRLNRPPHNSRFWLLCSFPLRQTSRRRLRRARNPVFSSQVSQENKTSTVEIGPRLVAFN